MNTEGVHSSGLVNPNWPLCTEVEALSRGWTTAEVEDGELADDPFISGAPKPDVDWFVACPVDCRACLELVHA